jgi:hypothetical protein
MRNRAVAVAVAGFVLVGCASDTPDAAQPAVPVVTADQETTTSAAVLATTTTTSAPLTLPEPVVVVDLPRVGTPSAFMVFSRSSVTVQRDQDGYISSGLVGYLGIRNQSIDFLARRTAYARPISVELRRQLSSRVETATLADSLDVQWDGIQEAGSTTIRDAGGEVLTSETFPLCPVAVERIDRDTRVRRPPSGYCGAHPLALGAMWQMVDGWAAPVSLVDQLDLPLGDYEVTVEISKDLAQVLKMTKPVTTFSLHVEPLDQTSSSDVPTDVPTDVSVVTDTTVVVDSVPFDPSTPTSDPFFDEGLYFPEPPPDPADSGAPILPHPTSKVDPADLPKDPSVLPDLRALPAWGMSVYLASNGREYLSYSATVWNAGPGALVIEGYRPQDSETMVAAQIFRKGDNEVGSLDIGTMEYHGGDHQHWHFLDFARYELTDSKKQLIERSAKQSWCLAATDAIDTTVDNVDLTQGAQDLFSQCGDINNVWIREALPVGWGDTYSDGYVEQHFDVTDLPNGTYYVKITANPFGNIAEAGDAKNNIAYRRIELSGEPGSRILRVPPHQGIDTESNGGFGGFNF